MTDHTAALLKELEWCIAEGHSGPRTIAALKSARAALDKPQQPATPPAPASQGDSDECAEILSNLIANIEENGLYSEEGMLTFLTQALSCLKPANPAPQQPAQGWQPIETAPKTIEREFGRHAYGPDFLALLPDGRCVVCRWWTHAKQDANNFVDDGDIAVHPTHWMALPLPPGAHPSQQEDDVRDAARLDWLVAEACCVQEHPAGSLYRICWPTLAEWQSEFFPTPRDAIDAAMSAAQDAVRGGGKNG